MINISGKSKAAVLAALYNASQPLGLGFLHYDPTPMTEEVAQKEIDARILPSTVYSSDRLYFDYLKGRVMKIDLSSDEFSPKSYDRDNGEGAAESALKKAGILS